jgi:hypothetical protein
MQKLSSLLTEFDVVDFNLRSPENENATIYARLVEGAFAGDSLAYSGQKQLMGFAEFCGLSLARESMRDWILLDNQTMASAAELLIESVNDEL